MLRPLQRNDDLFDGASKPPGSTVRFGSSPRRLLGHDRIDLHIVKLVPVLSNTPPNTSQITEKTAGVKSEWCGTAPTVVFPRQVQSECQELRGPGSVKGIYSEDGGKRGTGGSRHWHLRLSLVLAVSDVVAPTHGANVLNQANEPPQREETLFCFRVSQCEQLGERPIFSWPWWQASSCG